MEFQVTREVGTLIYATSKPLIKSSKNVLFCVQVSTRDLLHAVVGLYSISLSEMTPDVLYTTVCEKWGRTILLLRDIPGNLN